MTSTAIEPDIGSLLAERVASEANSYLLRTSTRECRKCGLQPVDAEDLAQSCLLRVTNRVRRNPDLGEQLLSDPKKLAKYCLVTLRRQLATYLQKKDVRTPPMSVFETPEDLSCIAEPCVDSFVENVKRTVKDPVLSSAVDIIVGDNTQEEYSRTYNVSRRTTHRRLQLADSLIRSLVPDAVY